MKIYLEYIKKSFIEKFKALTFKKIISYILWYIEICITMSFFYLVCWKHDFSVFDLRLLIGLGVFLLLRGYERVYDKLDKIEDSLNNLQKPVEIKFDNTIGAEKIKDVLNSSNKNFNV